MGKKLQIQIFRGYHVLLGSFQRVISHEFQSLRLVNILCHVIIPVILVHQISIIISQPFIRHRIHKAGLSVTSLRTREIRISPVS